MPEHHFSRGGLTPETPPCVRLCFKVSIKSLNGNHIFEGAKRYTRKQKKNLRQKVVLLKNKGLHL